MQEWRISYVNRREVPVLISDEKEALLAAKAAGRAIIGLWRPGQAMEEISAAQYVVEQIEDLTDEYLERVARRHLGLPWRICESDRMIIRELFEDDFDEVWENKIGLGFETVEALQSYTKHHYSFYEFGFWGLVEKESGELIGVAGLKVPEFEASRENEGREDILTISVAESQEAESMPAEISGTEPNDEMLELGYHIFYRFRRKGYASEACRAILKYGAEELGITGFLVRIDKENKISRHLAEGLGFRAGKR